jgi:hypothetical protein
MYCQNHFIFHFNKQTVIKLINAKMCNIQISLHMKFVVQLLLLV